MATQRIYRNKSLDRGLRILGLFNEINERMTASEIAALLNVTPATLYPTLHTLVAHDYLTRDDQKRFRLGLKLLERSGQVLAQLDIQRIARIHLRKLARSSQVTADLAILYGNEVLYLAREAGHPAAIASSVIGRRVPLHCTSLGKVLLAFMPAKEREDVIRSISLDAYTPNTITDPDRLKEELVSTRQRGYSLDIEEFHLGTACVGAPIQRHSGDVIAAISLMLTDTGDVETTNRVNAQAVLQTANDISHELGFSEPTLNDGTYGG